MTQERGVVALVGGGFMGTGIAAAAAAAGYRVVVREIDARAADAALVLVTSVLSEAHRRGKLADGVVEEACGRVETTADLAAIADATLVIEAVPEDPRLKASIFEAISDVVAPDAIIASNTSALPIAELAAAVERPARVVGLHFFSPVLAMPLVEVVQSLETSDATMGAAEDFVRSLGKHPVRTKDRSGFIVNMLLVPYLMAAVRMHAEGFAAAEDIDAAMKLGCGHRMGPLELCDFIGLDVVLAVCDALFGEFKQAEYAPPPILKRMVALGRLGRKTGRGFYDYRVDAE